MHRLENKIALITGGARGIGAETAVLFAMEGAVVYSTDIRELGEEVRRKFTKYDVKFSRLDVRKEADWNQTMAEILSDEGRLDVLVNNAGVMGYEDGFVPHDPENASLEDWRAVHATNLDGVFLGCKYAIRVMRKQNKGSIINIASRSGLVGVPRACAYASSKSAIRNHTRSVALYCAEEGLDIRCNTINPAAVMTPMWDTMLGIGADRESNIRKFVKDIPQNRFADPWEVALAAVMLASDEVPYMTGAELNIDGGIMAGSISIKNEAK